MSVCFHDTCMPHMFLYAQQLRNTTSKKKNNVIRVKGHQMLVMLFNASLRLVHPLCLVTRRASSLQIKSFTWLVFPYQIMSNLCVYTHTYMLPIDLCYSGWLRKCMWYIDGV